MISINIIIIGKTSNIHRGEASRLVGLGQIRDCSLDEGYRGLIEAMRVIRGIKPGPIAKHTVHHLADHGDSHDFVLERLPTYKQRCLS